MKPHHTPRLHRPPPRDLPPLTWPAPLDALPPLAITKAPESPGWADTLPVDLALPLEADLAQPAAFEESLTGLQVRELMGSHLFDRLFGPATTPPRRG